MGMLDVVMVASGVKIRKPASLWLGFYYGADSLVETDWWAAR